jgi:colanic acid/amylovoran biosynthesis glycosyltransferase
MTQTEEPRPSIAYVMTHYPRVALSFLSGEIDEMEARGATIHPFAMNLPDEPDLLSAEARARYSKTSYLKRSWAELLGAFASTALRHPVAMAKLVGTAVSSARGDLPLTVRRFSHLLQACLVARECDRRGIRHLHAQFGQAPATIAWFASEILNFPDKGRAGWSFTIHGFQDFVDESVARLDLKAASAAFVVCVSDFTRSQLCRLLHPSLWDRAKVVRCGIDLDHFRMRGARPQSSPPRLVTVGRLSSEKGQVVLLRACRLLAERGTQVHLTLIGSGPLEGLIRDEVANATMEDLVELTGELPPEAVRSRLEEADVFCLTSFAEGLPISIMEAMAVGVPVIATSIAGIPELVVNEKTGLLVPPGNVVALADALEKLLGNAKLRQKIVGAARKRVEERHERHRNCQAMFDLLASRSEVKA